MDISQNDISIYNGIEATDQSVYDSYNKLMFSKDTRVFSKMMKRAELYLNVKDIVGDILEFGVFKGASIALWSKLINMYEPNIIITTKLEKGRLILKMKYTKLNKINFFYCSAKFHNLKIATKTSCGFVHSLYVVIKFF